MKTIFPFMSKVRQLSVSGVISTTCVLFHWSTSLPPPFSLISWCFHHVGLYQVCSTNVLVNNLVQKQNTTVAIFSAGTQMWPAFPETWNELSLWTKISLYNFKPETVVTLALPLLRTAFAILDFFLFQCFLQFCEVCQWYFVWSYIIFVQ